MNAMKTKRGGSGYRRSVIRSTARPRLRRCARACILTCLVSLACSPLTGCAARAHVELAVGQHPGEPCRAVQGDGGAAILWVTPRDTRDARRLSIWCRSVGPIVFARGTAGREAGADSLVIVSWNTHVGAARLSAFIHDLRAGVFSAGQPIAHFALLLQEAYRADAALPALPQGLHVPRRLAGSTREAIADVARREGLWLFYVPSMRNGGVPGSRAAWLPEDRGNAIVSTLPFERLAAVELPIAAQRRVVAVASVRLASPSARPAAVRLVSGHFDSTVGWKRLWFVGARAHRARQAAALVDALSLTMDAAVTATVVGADLNTWDGPSEAAYTRLRDAFPETPAPSKVPTFGLFRRRFDFLFFRVPPTWLRGYRVISDNRYGSDHYPLIGWVRTAS